MFKLTLADVKTKGLAAYNAKQLSAQGPTPACQYRDKSGRPCIVGAALPDDVALSLPQTQPVWGLSGLVKMVDADPKDQREIEDLQRIHDVWALLAGDGEQKVERAAIILKGVEGVDFTEVNVANVEKLLVERLSCN